MNATHDTIRSEDEANGNQHHVRKRRGMKRINSNKKGTLPKFQKGGGNGANITPKTNHAEAISTPKSHVAC